MAKHQKVQEWHTCDVCCEQCEPVGTIEIPFAYSMDLVYKMRVRVSAYIPYATSDGDVCFKCFRKHIQKWIADQERRASELLQRQRPQSSEGGKMNVCES